MCTCNPPAPQSPRFSHWSQTGVRWRSSVLQLSLLCEGGRLRRLIQRCDDGGGSRSTAGSSRCVRIGSRRRAGRGTPARGRRPWARSGGREGRSRAGRAPCWPCQVGRLRHAASPRHKICKRNSETRRCESKSVAGKRRRDSTWNKWLVGVFFYSPTVLG